MTLLETLSFTPRRTGISLGRVVDVWRQRRALANLDDSALEDIGVSFKDAHREANRAVWDVPNTWRC